MSAPREICYWSVAGDGSRTPLLASGVRVPLGPDRWLAVDFKARYQPPLSVEVALRVARPSRGQPQHLALLFQAGNSASVMLWPYQVASHALEVVPVDDRELDGDLFQWLAKTTSGDPAGEMVLARPDRPSSPDRTFIVEYGQVGRIEVTIRLSVAGMLEVNICCLDTRMERPNVPFPTLEMAIHPLGANLVSFRFQEVVGTIVE